MSRTGRVVDFHHLSLAMLTATMDSC